MSLTSRPPLFFSRGPFNFVLFHLFVITLSRDLDLPNENEYVGEEEREKEREKECPTRVLKCVKHAMALQTKLLALILSS